MKPQYVPYITEQAWHVLNYIIRFVLNMNYIDIKSCSMKNTKVVFNCKRPFMYIKHVCMLHPQPKEQSKQRDNGIVLHKKKGSIKGQSQTAQKFMNLADEHVKV